MEQEINGIKFKFSKEEADTAFDLYGIDITQFCKSAVNDFEKKDGKIELVISNNKENDKIKYTFEFVNKKE